VFGNRNLLQMKTFCNDEAACRHAALVQYFGEAPAPAAFPGGRCGGGCDACATAAGTGPQPGDWQPLVRGLEL
jgi:RecQ zinc-binding